MSQLYPFIEEFLLENRLKKTLKAFEKEVGVIEDKSFGATLADIFAAYVAANESTAQEGVAKSKKKKSKRTSAVPVEDANEVDNTAETVTATTTTSPSTTADKKHSKKRKAEATNAIGGGDGDVVAAPEPKRKHVCECWSKFTLPCYV
jgi:hypothetical protein